MMACRWFGALEEPASFVQCSPYMPMCRTLAAGCWARAARGHDTAAPPSSVMNSRRLMSNMARFPPPASAGVPSPRLLAGYRRDFKPELYPQKHGQEDQDRVQRDPHDVGSPTPPLLYGLLAHGKFSLA
jgi:hypothetical protein